MAAKKNRGKPAGGGNLKMLYAALGIIAVVGAGAIIYAAKGGGATATEPIQLSAETLSNTSKLVEAAKGIEAGPDGAKVRLLVFSDYMCPGCRHWATTVEPVIKSEFVSKGLVQLVYYDFPLGGGHKYSFLVSRATRCAEEQGKFWELHDLAFARQQDWSYRPEVAR